MTKILNFLRDENGATAIEYGLIAAGISVAIIAAVNTRWHQPQHDLPSAFRPAQVGRLRRMAFATTRSGGSPGPFSCVRR